MPPTVLQGVDALLSIVQMPKGVPVGTLAIGQPGAANAALLAAEILALERAGAPREAPGLACGTDPRGTGEQRSVTAILPGATLGILGGGQLGRMTAMAARTLGYHLAALDPDPSCAARFVVETCITAGLRRRDRGPRAGQPLPTW